MNGPSTGVENSSSFAMKKHSRGNAAPTIGGSQNEMWFDAMISPPSRGTRSRPFTSQPAITTITIHQPNGASATADV